MAGEHAATGRFEQCVFPALMPFNGGSSIKAAPRFNNRKAGDFTLSPRSPLRDAGWKEAPRGKALYLGAIGK